ncbi:MAG: cation:proton antiporter [Betaproteobacteria bacterium]|nr:cation:proton antiporter [Betaproteobacteria bacterium]
MHSTLQLVLIILAAGVFASVLFRRAGLPSMLGYLIVGVLVGPGSLGWVPDRADTRYIAEFGVVFLMFSIGLEFSLQRLKAMRSAVFGLGLLQVVLTLGAVAGIAFASGLHWQAAIAVGSVLAMSSTAIVSKMLVAQSELHSLHGRQVMGLLLFQDLAVVPLLILIPALGAPAADLLPTLGLALLKAALLLVFLLVFGQRIMGWWVHLIARYKSTELFMLNVLLMTLGLAYLTAEVGLSLALGAFVAGMLISETDYRYQVEADIKPFRDVLLGLFFLTVGMLLQLREVVENLPWVGLALAGLVGGKALLIAVLARVLGEEPGVALRTGLYTAQAGEFGFVLLTLAEEYHELPGQVMQVVLAAMVLSMLLAPLIIHRTRAIVHWLLRADRATREREAHSVAQQTAGIRDHVVICGFGRTGQSVAGFLKKAGIPFVALEMDPRLVKAAAQAGESVVFGDASRREVLHAAGIGRARALVVAYADEASALKILHVVRDLHPGLPVVVRTLDDKPLEKLRQAGAAEVVPEVLEGSLMLASQTLMLLEVPLEEVFGHVQEARASRYFLLKGSGRRGRRDGEPEGRASEERLHSVVLHHRSAAVGRTLRELKLDRYPVEVMAVRRRHRSVEIDATLRLEPGDTVIVRGDPDHIQQAERDLSGPG